jgi:hypothetical protein
MIHQKARRLNVLLSTLSTILALVAFQGCSTSGGDQKSVLGHESTGRDLKGSVSEVNNRTQDVFKDMGIQITGTQSKESGHERDLSGKAGDKDVSVKMTDIGNGMTHVDVSAKNGALQWNEDYAQSVLSKIIEKS